MFDQGFDVRFPLLYTIKIMLNTLTLTSTPFFRSDVGGKNRIVLAIEDETLVVKRALSWYH